MKRKKVIVLTYNSNFISLLHKLIFSLSQNCDFVSYGGGVTRGGCGFEPRLRQELSTTEVRPLSKAPNPQLLPGRIASL